LQAENNRTPVTDNINIRQVIQAVVIRFISR
jgi:hypothetical protein